MTIIRFKVNRPTAAGTDAPSIGKIRFRPTARRVKPGEDGAVSALVLPEPFTVEAPASGAFDVTLDPSGPSWSWELFWHDFGVNAWTENILVPDRPYIDYADPDLARVDPKTHAPAAAPTAAWWAALDEAKLGVYALPDPDDADVLVLHFPAWHVDPADDLALIMPIMKGSI